MNGRRRIALLLACVVVALAVAWYSGGRFAPSAPPPPAGSVRLGPDPGEPVVDYMARLRADLPPAGAVAPALVQFVTEQRVADVIGTVEGATPGTAVFRVPLPRVQTALRFEPIETGVPPTTALHTARDRARLQADADAVRLTGRQRDVAAAEAAALADPGCRCVLALVVRADRAGLEALATRPGVRAVQAAPPGTTSRELAVAPLLPGQTERADPLPDDGVLPAPPP
jgi:hypothetical protein